VCTAICAGLDIKGLIGDGALVEVPEEKPVDNMPQLTNPHMNNEEGLHMNTFRAGKDARLIAQNAEADSSLDAGQKYNGS